jgi:spore coat polysaccharide biosynthesis protein SpsF
MNVIAVIPATTQQPDREGVSGLTPMHGQPLLGHVLGRLSQVEKLAGIRVTTSDDAADNAIADYCAARGIVCLRGAPDDLMGRVLAALTDAGAKGGVMVDARCPLIDPAIVDHVVNLVQMTDGMLDWVGNTASPSYPQGMEVDGFTAAAMTEADRRCAEPDARRQGPAFLRQNSRLYRLLSVTAPTELQRPQVDLRANGAEAMARIESVLQHFGAKADFSLAEILAFLDGQAAQ